MGDGDVVSSVCLVDQGGYVVGLFDCIPRMVYTRYASLCLYISGTLIFGTYL